MKREISLAVIGCGHWGKNFIRNFTQLGVLKYVCDLHQAACEEVTSQYRVESKTFDEILESDVDGIVFATPASEHYHQAKAALLAGKHVFVEKPLSLHVVEAQELKDLAQERGLIVMVGHLLQYHPVFIKLKELVQKGVLGKLKYVSAHRLNMGICRTDVDSNMDLAPHDVSMILSLIQDMPESVFSSGFAMIDHDKHDALITHLQFPNGVKSHIYVSWLSPVKEQRLTVVGDQCIAVFDDCEDWSDKLKLYPYEAKGTRIEKKVCQSVEVPFREPLLAECEQFITSIKSGMQPFTDAQEGIDVLEVLNRSAESLIKEGHIELA